MFQIPEIEPQQITAGDTFDFKKKLPGCNPGDGYVLKYSLRGPKSIDIVSTDNGDGWHLISVAASVSETWPPGVYYWQSFVTKSTEKRTITRGRLTVLENLTAISDEGFDGRTLARQILEAIRASMFKKASRLQEEYEVDGIKVRDMTPEQMIKFEDRFAREVAREEAAEALSIGRKSRRVFQTRFVRPR